MTVRRFTLLIIAATCVAAMPFACVPEGSIKTETKTAPASVAETSGGTAAFPDGALPEGATASIVTGTAPTEFTALEGATGASAVYVVSATAVNGVPLEKALKPFTLVLKLGELPPADTPRRPDDLCVVMKFETKLYVWRQGGFEIIEDGTKINLATDLFGVYQVVYCGQLDMQDFVLVGGTKPADPTTTADDGGTTEAGDGTDDGPPPATADAIVCDRREFDGTCREFPRIEDSLEPIEQSCMESGGIFQPVGDCVPEARVGECVWEYVYEGVSVKYAESYYSPRVLTEEGLAECSRLRGDYPDFTFWFFDADGVGVDVPLPAEEYPLYCHIPDELTCIEVFDTEGASIQDYCAAKSGTVTPNCIGGSSRCGFATATYFYDPDHVHQPELDFDDEADCTAAGGNYAN